MEHEGRWAEGNSLVIKTVDDVAFHGNGHNLVVTDFSEPSNPREISRILLPAEPRALAAMGGWIYVTAADRLHVVSVSESYILKGEGSLLLSHEAGDVTIEATTAFVTTHGINNQGGLHAIDISDPDLLEHVGFLDIGSSGRVTVSDTLAYVAGGSNGFQLVDVHDPERMQRIGLWKEPNDGGHVSTGGSVTDVVVRDTLAYVLRSSPYGERGLRVLNVADPSRPESVHFENIRGSVEQLAVRGDRAYVTSSGNSLHIFDLSRRSQPRVLGVVELDVGPAAIDIRGDVVYVSGRDIRGIDVSDPSAPETVSRLELPARWREPVDVVVKNVYAYLADRGSFLRVIDVAVPFDPRLAAELHLPSCRMNGITLAGEMIYVACLDAGGLLAIDVSNPNNPQEIGNFRTQEAAFSVAAAGKKAFLGTEEGVYLLDVSDPRAPEETGFFPVGDDVWDLYVSGDRLYAVASTHLHVIDVSNPRQPVRIGAYDAPGSRRVVDVAGSLAYLGGASPKLDVVDVSDLADIRSIGAYDTDGGSAAAVALEGNFAYIVIPDLHGTVHGLRVVDVTDPQELFEAAYFGATTSGQGLAVAGDMVFVADAREGLFLIRNTPPIVGRENETEEASVLKQNYPNPSGNATTITYELAQPQRVTVQIFDVLGREIARLVDGHRTNGLHSVHVNTSSLPAGVYVYRLSASDFTQERRFTVIR